MPGARLRGSSGETATGDILEDGYEYDSVNDPGCYMPYHVAERIIRESATQFVDANQCS